MLLRNVITSGSGDGRTKLLFVIDKGLYAHHSRLPADIRAYCRTHRDALLLARDPLLVDGGEDSKNDPAWIDFIHGAIDQSGLCRHSYIVAVGGGAVIDAVGFAAATAHRGIRLIRVPTTILAQADASIGVKNGVNAYGKKNYLGTFAPPWAVLNDFTFLETLSQRHWIAGAAEAVKVALIKDRPFFDFIEQNALALAKRDKAAMKRLIHGCAALHLHHIATAGDPFETGSSRPLDFGHWAAHKLEQATQYRLNHGEAVAIGIAVDATYSHRAGLLPKEQLHRIIKVLQTLGFSLQVPELDESILEGLEEFREHLGGQLTIILLSGIGKPLEVHKLDEIRLMKSIRWIRTLEKERRENLTEGKSRRPRIPGKTQATKAGPLATPSTFPPRRSPFRHDAGSEVWK